MMKLFNKSKLNHFIVNFVLKRYINQSQRTYPTAPDGKDRKKFGIVLVGCGRLDGTDIHEAAALSIHISKLNFEPVFFAPKILQADVVDHDTECPNKEMRCAFREGARIARGKLKPLTDLTHCEVEAVAFPGGMGAIKTLSDFAVCQYTCNIDPEVVRVIKEFRSAEKPMAFLSLSAILPVKVLQGVKITLGKRGLKWPHADVIESVNRMGAVIEPRGVDNYTFDRQNLVFSTPAFMYNGTFYEVFEGIGNMLENMYKIMK